MLSGFFMSKIDRKLIYSIWGLLALFYSYQYFLRVGPSVMANDLRCDFNLTAEQFALIPAIYLYAYGILQIPIGFFLDSVGVKRTMMVSIFICTIGALLFYSTQSVYIAYFSRLLIGAGSACAFITPLKLVGDHLPDGKKGLFMGLTLTLGTVGALIAGKPQTLLMDQFGWRNAGLISTSGGLLLFICVIFFIPTKSKIDQYTKKPESLSVMIGMLKETLKNRKVLLYAMLAFGLYTPLTVLSDTWGITFLMQKYNLSLDDAASCTSFIFIGLCIGSFAIPAYFEPKNMMKMGIQFGLISMFTVFVTILYNDQMTLIQLQVLLFLLGFMVGSEMLCFTCVSNFSKDGLRGMSLGFANTINMTGGAILQQLVGFLLDYFWSGSLNEKGIRVYSADDFEKTFAFFIGVYIFCIALSMILPKDKIARKEKPF